MKIGRRNLVIIEFHHWGVFYRQGRETVTNHIDGVTHIICGIADGESIEPDGATEQPTVPTPFVSSIIQQCQNHERHHPIQNRPPTNHPGGEGEGTKMANHL